MHDLELPELPGYIPSVDIQELRRQEYLDNRLPSIYHVCDIQHP